MKDLYLLMVLLLLFVTGCQDTKKIEDDISNLEDRITALESNYVDINLELFNLGLKIDDLQKNVITFDPANAEGFQAINTGNGYFLFAIRDIKPYLDGYRIFLDVGNPNYATYNGIKLKAKWGKRFTYSDSILYDTWKNSLLEKEVSITHDIKPGTWNKINFNISPVKIDEFGYLSLSVETNSISLYTK